MITPDLMTGIAFWVFKALWESRNETYKLLSQRLQQSIFYASKEYQANYIARHGAVNQVDCRPSVPLADIYVPPTLVGQDGLIPSPHTKVINHREIDYLSQLKLTRDGITLVQQYDRLVIYGETGIGKTTLLKHIGLTAFESQPQTTDSYIPVFVQIAIDSGDDFDLEAHIEGEFEACGFPEHQSFVESALKRGKLLLLIDNLDCLSLRSQDQVLRQIDRFAALYPANKFVLTRQRLHPALGNDSFHGVYLLGFSSHQAKTYIAKVTRFYDWATAETAQTEDIWHYVSETEKATKYIAYNPCCLSIVLSLYQSNQKKISSKTVLYEKVLAHLLHASICPGTLMRTTQGVQCTLEMRLAILAEMAYVCLKSGRTDFHYKEIHRLHAAIATRKKIAAADRDEHLDEVLVRRNGHQYQFKNRLIQKTLVAHHLLGNLRLIDSTIQEFIDVPAWKDVFIFLSGMQGGDYLISVLQDSLNIKIEHRLKLCYFLNWVSQAADHVNISTHAAANRCYAIFILFEVMLLFSDHHQKQEVIAKILGQVADLATDIDPEMSMGNLTGASKKTEFSLTFKRFINPNIMRGLSLDRVLDIVNSLADRAVLYQLMDPENCQRLTKTIRHIKTHIAGKTVSRYHRKVCEKNLYYLWKKSLSFNLDFLDSSPDELQIFYLYCRANGIAASCLKEAFYVSGKLKKSAMERILKPVHVNESYLPTIAGASQ